MFFVYVLYFGIHTILLVYVLYFWYTCYTDVKFLNLLSVIKEVWLGLFLVPFLSCNFLILSILQIFYKLLAYTFHTMILVYVLYFWYTYYIFCIRIIFLYTYYTFDICTILLVYVLY